MQKLLKMLMSEGQHHVYGFWSMAGVDNASKRRLMKQLLELDLAYPGGLSTYLRNAKQLLEDSRCGKNPYTGCKVAVPHGVAISAATGSGVLAKYEEVGMQAVAKCTFVLVAGGLGERLGYHGIKLRSSR
jgi:UDP-sugar pyrophosphorylase